MIRYPYLFAGLGLLTVSTIVWLAIGVTISPDPHLDLLIEYVYYPYSTILVWVSDDDDDGSSEQEPPLGDLQLVMVRIQKTGTKTFLGNLKAIYAAKGLSYCANMPWCCTSVPDYSPGNRVKPCDQVMTAFRGAKKACSTLTEPHSDYADLMGAAADEFSLVVLVRDPVARTISEYKHLSGGSNKPRKNWDYTPADYEPKTWQNFLAYLRDERNAPGMRNRQTRMLAGCGSGRRCSDVYETEEAMLEEALRHLSQAAFVGISERFEETLDMLWIRFGLERPKNTDAYRRMDQYDGTDMFAVEDVKEILRYNHLDDRLYHEALEIFNRQLAHLQ